MVTAIELTTIVARQPEVTHPDPVAKFPDLNEEDRILVRSLIDGYIHKFALPDRFQNAKNTLIARIKNLQSAVDIPGQPQSTVLKMIARLINLSEVMNMTKVSPGQYLDAPYCSEPVAVPRLCSSENGANVLPEELKILLDVGEGDKNFLLYFNQQVRHVFFVPDLTAGIKLLNSHKYSGVCEAISRTVIVDAWQESAGTAYSLWEQAATLVHETAHIEYDYLTAGGPVQDHDRGERYAIIIEKSYLANLITLGAPLEKNRPEIIEAFNNKIARLAELNQKLGLAPADYSISK